MHSSWSYTVAMTLYHLKICQLFSGMFSLLISINMDHYQRSLYSYLITQYLHILWAE